MRSKKGLLILLILVFCFIIIDRVIILINQIKSENFLKENILKDFQTENCFTLVVLPDTQYYSANYPFIFSAQVRWIIKNKNRLNIAFVSHLGDIVDQGNKKIEWEHARNSLSKLDEIVPYATLPGNHDFDSKDNEDGIATFYNHYFPFSKFVNKPWWGGNYLKNKNSYQLFSVGSAKFIILHLEAEMPNDVLIWARKILNLYPDREAIISTHIYLDENGERTKSASFRKGGSSGEDIWNNLIKNHCNIFMVLSSHALGETRRTSINNCGKPVFEIMQNYQHRRHGGNGWLRFYVFNTKKNKISAYTYSPYLKKFETDSDSQFVLEYNLNSNIKSPIEKNQKRRSPLKTDFLEPFITKCSNQRELKNINCKKNC